jgi:uncharacterized protein
MNWGDSLLGLTVGFLVGLTGVGGGAVMTPLLILTGRAFPVVAVGTDLIWAMLTKSVGTLLHYRKKTLNFQIVFRLASGSIPGSLAGVIVLDQIRKHTNEQFLNRFVLRAVGVALILVAFSMVKRTFWKDGPTTRMAERLHPGMQRLLTIAMGALIGFLVSLTSVGSGSLILAALLLLYPQVPVSRLVGADLCHAVLLSAVSGMGHIGIGSVNFPLAARLLIGSVPGIWLGTKLSVALPEVILRPILATVLLGLGYKLL